MIGSFLLLLLLEHYWRVELLVMLLVGACAITDKVDLMVYRMSLELENI
jgi:hypothetical protein